MKEQSVDRHTRYNPLQHFVWLPLSLVLLISVFAFSIYQLLTGEFTLQTLLLIALVVLAIIPGMLARMYAVTLQDRLIRTEEQFRYYTLTTKRMDSSITMAQLIALRFASDEEFIALVDRTVAEELSATEIKTAIEDWRADHQRV